MRIPVRSAQPEFLLPALLVLALILALPGCSGDLHPDLHSKAGEVHDGLHDAGDSEDAVAEITAWQTRRDDAGRNDLLSPFTAVRGYYIDEGVTARIGADGASVDKDPDPAMEAMAAVTFRDDGFWFEPVDGSRPPLVHQTDDNGEPVPEGSEIAGAHVLGGDELVGLHRYFLTTSPQSGLGRIIVYDPESPAKKSFDGFKWFPPAPHMKVKATWVPAEDPEERTIATSRGLAKQMFAAGRFEFEVDGTPLALMAFASGPVPEDGERLFIPFRDATTGKETYEVGRYTYVSFQGEEAEHFINFNRANNPSCNYSDHYNCPVPPSENRLTVAIRAGEMTYPAHGS